MNTPICDFVADYMGKAVTRLHMPGHKGVGQLEGFDITEVDGADVLYHPEGIIRQSQENAALLFGTAKTVYSTEGSSLAIRAMVYLTRLYAGKRPVIAAGRNAHKTFVTAAALQDADVKWLYPEQQRDLLSCRITDAQLDAFLQGREVDAVYITSPDYLGNVADIASLAQVCHRHNALLLVDNAHGAYLRFLQEDQHPITLGADLCCDSAHKTLPVLTGGAYLHVSKNAPALFLEQAEKAMSLFASTSPSYLILQSLDRCNRYLCEGYRENLAQFVSQVTVLKEKLLSAGYCLAGHETIKLTIAPKSYGYTGSQLAQCLQEQNMVCEFSDPDYLVLMLTPENGTGALEKLEKALLSLPKKSPIEAHMPSMEPPAQAMPMHDAIMQAGHILPLSQCLGKTLTAPTVSCPPAIPVLVCGETVSKEAIAVMEYYEIEKLEVI